jgi:nicotinamide-nucleotide amidase
VAVAESCTGGAVAESLTSVPGASAWFGYGFVTYANAAKRSLLGVTDSALNDYGAVSQLVAAEMAEGALVKSGADWALATTGIAGPDGGTADKPVGTVWFAWANKRETKTRVQHFSGDRTAIRRQATEFALSEFIKLIKITV